MRFLCLIFIFLIAGYIIGYYGDICYACIARKKLLLDKLGLEVKEDEPEDCGPKPLINTEQGVRCRDGKWEIFNLRDLI